MRITQRERDKMTKSVMLSSSKQQQVDARPNAKLDFFAPVMKLSVSGQAQQIRSENPACPLLFYQPSVLFVLVCHQRHFHD